MEPIRIDRNGMARPIHLRGDVVGLAPECFEQLRDRLDAGLIGVRDVRGEGADDRSSRGGTFLNLPLMDAKRPSHICSDRQTGAFGENSDREYQTLGDLATDFPSLNTEAFPQDATPHEAAAPEKLELRPHRQEGINLEVDAEVTLPKLPLRDNDLPPQDARHLDAVGTGNGLYSMHHLDTCKFSLQGSPLLSCGKPYSHHLPIIVHL